MFLVVGLVVVWEHILYFANLADIAAVTTYQTNNTGLYKPSGAPASSNGISFYFNEIKSYFGQSLVDQLLDTYLSSSNLYIDKLVVNEWHIYGSSRLGIYKADVLVASKTVHITNGTGNTGTAAESEYNSTELSPLITPVLDLNYYSQTRGAKNYELSNHLGNVLVVITDKKTLCSNKEVYSTDFKTGTNGFDGGWSKYTQGGPNWSGIDQYNGSIVTNDNGRLKTTATVGYGGNRGLVNTIDTKSYTFTFDLDIGNTTGLYVNARATNGSNDYTGTNLAQIYVTASGTYTLTFTAAATATTQLLFEKDNYGTSYFYIDNAKVEETIATAPGYYMADVVTANDYSPFGAPMATRSYTAPNSSYRFAFNGMERDNETYGEGNAYDFGARICDVRLGRWLGVDPKANKYPHESPFAFVANSPLVCMDPDGEEKIVVTGGADLHNKNRMNFVMASKVQLQNYLKEVKENKSQEKVTWMIFDCDYSPDEKKQFAAYAKANGLSAPIYVKSAIEVKNYLNSQSTKAQNLSDERKKDQITDLSAFSHGIPSTVAFGYGNMIGGTPYDMDKVDKTDFNITVAQQLDKGAFAQGCQTDLYSCNSATPGANLKANFATRSDMIKSSLALPNLVTQLSRSTGQTVTGLIGRSNYLPTASGKLPSAGKTGGDYSPTVRGKSIQSIKVTATNGKAKTN